MGERGNGGMATNRVDSSNTRGSGYSPAIHGSGDQLTQLSYEFGIGGRTMETHTPFTHSSQSSPVHCDYSVDSRLGHTHNGQVEFAETSPSSGDISQAHTTFAENLFGEDAGGSKTQGRGDNDEEEESNVPPPWSELKTKAGKERKRLPLACIACRRKKIRCSGEKPACKHCLRSRIPCVYKVTTRKAAPRTDYMAMLDKRLKRMEERIIKILPKDDQDIVERTGRAVVKPTLRPPHGSQSPARKRGAQQAFDELEEWASAPRTGLLIQDSGPAESAMDTENDEQDLLHEGADKLPPKEIQEHLSEVFFDNVYGQSYHLLHKPSFMRKLAQGTIPPVLMLAVCAISARFSNHPALHGEPAFLRGEMWASPARDIAMKRYDVPNITILIVYLILGLHEFGTCHGGRSWMFGGMAQRMAYALQLHQDLDHDPRSRALGKNDELTFTDREIRRRTMWSCFMMDRFNSSGTERPPFVAHQYIKTQLPIKEKYYQMELTGPTEDLEGSVPNPIEPGAGEMADAKENMGAAAYFIRLVSIWGKLIHYVNHGGKQRDGHPMWSEASEFQQIKREMKRWEETLPASLHYNSENLQIHASEKIANQFIFVHIAHQQVLLFMNQFAIPAPGSRQVYAKDTPEHFLADAARSAVAAANQISALVAEAMEYGVVAPFAGYSAFFSSTVHIHGAFSKNVQLQETSKQNLVQNVKYLTQMKKYWGMFHFVTDNLRDLYQRHADAASSGVKDAKDGASRIFQYGDWFTRYPRGMSGSGYEDGNPEIKTELGSDAVLSQKSDLQSVEDFFAKLPLPSETPQGPPQVKKMPKKRRSSRTDKGKAAQSFHESRAQSDAMARQLSGQAAPMSSMQVTSEMPSSSTFGDDVPNLHPPSMQFSPGFPHSPNSILVAQQQQQQQRFVPPLGQQMLLDSSMSTDASMHPKQGAFSVTSNPNLDGFDFGSTLPSTLDPNNPAYWDLQTMGLFMPYNINPPVTGEEQSSFGTGDYDWGSVNALFGPAPGLGGMDPLVGQPLNLESEHGSDPSEPPGSGMGLGRMPDRL